MKAKIIIAIGLVAAMTLEMSTSVFAGDPIDISSNPYDDYPRFDEWDTPYGPSDNVFHAKGQGWLESGVGVNETVTNVIVPTTPNINIRYGQPGLFDFGFDPQRLVKRTVALKYRDTEDFTDQAKDTGVYFINGGELFGSDLNTYDCKSVKLIGTNIGTEPVTFTVSANLAGGKNLEILSEEPKQEPLEKDALKWFSLLYEGSIGTKWKASLDQGANDNIVGFGEAIKDDGLVSVTSLSTYEIQKLNNFLNSTFSHPDFADRTGSDLVKRELENVKNGYDPKSEAAVNFFTGQLISWFGWDMSSPLEVPSSGPTGMFLGLNVAPGTEITAPVAYEESATETAFRTSNEGTTDAAATFTQVVDGTPGNYKMIWDPGKKDYRKAIIPSDDDNYEPFRTVAFWFRGAATYNDKVVIYSDEHPEGIKIPALDFTWSFSKKLPDAPKLVSVNGTAVTEIPEEFTNDSFVEGKIALAFDTVIAAVDYTADPASGTWNPIDSQRYSIDGKTLTIKESILGGQPNPKYVRVKFAGRDTTCILKFNNVWS